MFKCQRCLDTGFANIGPTGTPKCPICENSSDVCVPFGSPNLLRCANCKSVYKPELCQCKKIHWCRLVLVDSDVKYFIYQIKDEEKKAILIDVGPFNNKTNAILHCEQYCMDNKFKYKWEN